MDDETNLIIAQHGMEGYGILISMFQTIYGNKGYYHKWTKREQILFSNRVSTSKNRVEEVVNDCIEWGIFDQEMYNEYQILTSKRIQQHYIDVTYRRSEIEINVDFLLMGKIDRKNIVYQGVSDSKNLVTSEVSDGKSTQSKIVSSKVSSNKVKSNKEESEPAPIKKIFNLYNSIVNSLPSARKLSDSRRRHIKARWKEEKDIDIFKEVFEKAEKSSFMRGKNKRNWTANLDWIIKNNSNFNKILEGKYDDEEGNDGESSKDSGEDEESWSDRAERQALEFFEE